MNDGKLIAQLVREMHAHLDRAAYYVVREDWSGLESNLEAVQQRVDRARELARKHAEGPATP